MLKCNKCKTEKESCQFYRDKNRKSGFSRWCKICMREQNRKWKEKNKDHVSEYMKSYREENRDTILENQKLYKRRNAKAISDKNKEWRNNNRDRIRTIKRNYYHNVEKHNIQVVIRERLGNRVRKTLKGINKSKNTMDLLGCTLIDFLKHIESLFTEGMSWDNMNLWHLDHIVPCSYFDLNCPEQQKECFNYKNLKPMWAKDNCSKQNRYVG
jgi:hypothetical protein